MTLPEGEPAAHYDRVTRAWGLLLGHDLHYGLFENGDESLGEATATLTQRMAERGALSAHQSVLDIGCGTGQPACFLAETYGCIVTGISTSRVGLEEASARAAARGLSAQVTFRYGDGMDNGLPTQSFDRVWVMESSHLMPDKARLLAEGARVLRPEGKLVLCDIVLRAPMSTPEVLRFRDDLLLLRDVFGRAKMEPLDLYARWAAAAGLVVETRDDVSDATRPTFDRWRRNAHEHRAEVIHLLGGQAWDQFVRSCDVLERFWAERRLGYGILIAAKDAASSAAAE